MLSTVLKHFSTSKFLCGLLAVLHEGFSSISAKFCSAKLIRSCVHRFLAKALFKRITFSQNVIKILIFHVICEDIIYSETIL